MNMQANRHFSAVVVCNSESSSLIIQGERPDSIVDSLFRTLHSGLEVCHYARVCRCVIESVSSEIEENRKELFGKEYKADYEDQLTKILEVSGIKDRHGLAGGRAQYRVYRDMFEADCKKSVEIKKECDESGYFDYANPACKMCKGDGVYQSTMNPNGIVSAWEIGGRFQGYFNPMGMDNLYPGICLSCGGRKTFDLNEKIASVMIDICSSGVNHSDYAFARGIAKVSPAMAIDSVTPDAVFYDGNCNQITAQQADAARDSGGEAYFKCPTCSSSPVDCPYNGEITTVGRMLDILNKDDSQTPYTLIQQAERGDDPDRWFARLGGGPFKAHATESPDKWVGRCKQLLMDKSDDDIVIVVDCR